MTGGHANVAAVVLSFVTFAGDLACSRAAASPLRRRLSAPGFVRTNEEVLKAAPTTGTGEGAAVQDVNGDGHADVLLCSMVPLDSPLLVHPESMEGAPFRLLLNDGSGNLSVAPAGSVPAGFACDAIVVADLDNDGDADLVWTRQINGSSCGVLINDGSGVFAALADAVPRCPLFAGGPAVGDLNNDGLLDLVVPGLNDINVDLPNIPSVVYTGLGDGRFAVEASTGAEDAEYPCQAAIVDVDEDGVQDLLMLTCNELESTTGGGWRVVPTPLRIYRNSFGDAGSRSIKFTDAMEQLTGRPEPYMGAWMGVAVCDFNNDGHLDLYFGQMGCLLGSTCPPQWRHLLLLNNGNQTYTEAGDVANVANERFNWGTACLDVDNDGFQDLVTVGNFQVSGLVQAAQAGVPVYSPGAVFRNPGSFPFTLVEEFGIVSGTGLAIGDLGQDGLPEIVIQQWEAFVPDENDTVGSTEAVVLSASPPVGNSWVRVHLVGTSSNRDGVGARVVVTFMRRSCSACPEAAAQQAQVVMAGASFFSSHDKVLTFGLGPAGYVTEIAVHWVGGLVQSEAFSSSDALRNTLVTITQQEEPTNMAASAKAVLLAVLLAVFAGIVGGGRPS